MSALRWEQLRRQLGNAESPASASGPHPDPRMASAEDDDPARGIILGVATTLIAFWLPLIAVAVRWWRR